jgi:L-lactate dehydrogenase complex protein LldE
MRIAFFPGCMIDMMYPEVGIAAVEVLERLGCEVELPKDQICCGQMFLNSGYEKETIPMMKQVIDAYSGYETIVSLSGSCLHAIVNEYPEYLDDDPDYGPRLARMRKNCWEFTDFIVNKLGVTDVGAVFNDTVTYHKSCHVTRLLGIKEPPLKLLENVKGLEYIEMAHADRCCGFGGTFSFKEPEISGEMVREKCRTIIESGAEVVTGVDSPCLMNIKGALSRMRSTGELDRDIRVMHIARILDAKE